MLTFLLISRHSPENCGLYNEKARKRFLELADKLERALLQKHGVELVGCWRVPTEHLSLMVIKAPSQDAFQKFVMEPEFVAMGAYDTIEIKMAISLQESIATLKQAK